MMFALLLTTTAENVAAPTDASSISLSSIVITFELNVVTVPLTVNDPPISTSPSTSKFPGMFTLKLLSPLIHASVPEPITSCLLPAPFGGKYVALVEFASSAGPMITLPVAPPVNP